MEDLGIVYIKNSMELKQVMISEAYRSQILENSKLEVAGDNLDLKFTPEGMLVSPFGTKIH